MFLPNFHVVIVIFSYLTILFYLQSKIVLCVIDRAECSCYICKKVMTSPLTTPCAHNFCKSCLEGAFDGQSFVRQRTCEGRRTLRAQKNIMKCPSCSNDIAEFLQNPQVCEADIN